MVTRIIKFQKITDVSISGVGVCVTQEGIDRTEVVCAFTCRSWQIPGGRFSRDRSQDFTGCLLFLIL